MFDIVKIGQNIARCRKFMNLSQMELAERLNISFQAVSNWERGQSMPDISKLSDLSAIFGVTIDELLDNGRAAVIINKLNNQEDLLSITTKDIADLGPILKPEQVDKMAGGLKDLDMREIESVAPYLSEQYLENLVSEIIQKDGKISSIVALAPFLSGSFLSRLVREATDKDTTFETIQPILPFIDESVIDEIAIKRYNGNLSSITSLAPFMSDATLSKLAEDALEKFGLNALSPIMPFIDTKIIENYIDMNRNR